MPIIQITYDLPLEIAKGMAAGDLRTLGTAAIRDSTGIAAHIREVSRTVSDPDAAVATAVVKGLRNPKAIAIGLGVVAVAAAGAGAAGWSARRKRLAQPRVPKCVEGYNASLSAYLEAIRDGHLDVEVLSQLVADLDAVKENSDNGTIALELSADESASLLRLVADYTHRLAEANAVHQDSYEKTKPASGENPVIDLRHYLEAQRQILDQSA